MRKLILLLSFLSINVINAEEYWLSIDKKHYKDAINVECDEPLVLDGTGLTCINPIPTCELPNVLNETQDGCINSVEKVGWIFTDGDSCGGMKQMNFNPNIYIARSRTRTRDISREIPEGYRWLEQSEYITLFNESTVSNKNDGIMFYHSTCGFSGYPMTEGSQQYGITFKTNIYGNSNGVHNSHPERYGITHSQYNYPNNHLGYFLYKEF